MELSTGRSELLDNLSRSAGVDLNGLRDKYRGISPADEAKRANLPQSGERIKQEDLAKLDNYKICKSCLGKGTVKTVYNHMVLEKDCEECDGESIVDKRVQEVMSQLS